MSENSFRYNEINRGNFKPDTENDEKIENNKNSAGEYLKIANYSSSDNGDEDGTIKLSNPHIKSMEEGDFLYHLGLGTKSHDLVEMFGDVKFVCMGGTPERMKQFAHYLLKEIGVKLPSGSTLGDLTKHAHRYSMFKTGPVLSVSHGMGISSISILLHEMIKLVSHAKIKDPIFFRIGTCGGLGLEGGTVIVSDGAVDEMLNHHYELPVLGKPLRRPAILDQNLMNELLELADPDDPYETVSGTTMCALDFYEGQGRLDGAFCNYTEDDKMDYLCSLREAGVKNIEMEATVFAALTHEVGIKAAIVCVALLNRINGDQVKTSKAEMLKWQERPQKLVARYIKQYLEKQKEEENGNNNNKE